MSPGANKIRGSEEVGDYCFRGHNFHDKVTVLCTLSHISVFLEINFFILIKIKEDNMYTIIMQ